MTHRVSRDDWSMTVDTKSGVDLTWKGETFTVESNDLTEGGWHREFDCDPCDREHLDEDSTINEFLPQVDRQVRIWHHTEHPDWPFVLCQHPVCVSAGNLLGVRHD